MKKFYFFIPAFLLTLVCSAQKIIFVNVAAGSGLQNGTSWNDAFTDLQQGLAAAQYGDTIWVAQGVYFPTPGADRSVSFEWKKGIQLLGGFQGNETAEAQRNPAFYATRLSANIGDSSIYTDNSYHVLRGAGLDEHTRIDGFIISDAYSVGAWTPASNLYGAGIFLLGSPFLLDSRPVISHCVFENDWAGGGGGGISMQQTDPDGNFQDFYPVNPVISDCAFTNCRSNVYGGSLYRSGPTLSASDTFSVSNCIFEGGYSYSSHGGAIYIESCANSTLAFRNCRVEQNYTQGGGGGGLYLDLYGPQADNVTLILDSCTFKGNSAAEGGGVYIFHYFNDNNQTAHINLFMNKCLFQENVARNEIGGAFLLRGDKYAVVRARLKDCRFVGNKVHSYFNASFESNYGHGNYDVELDGCSFLKNQGTFSNNLGAYALGIVESINGEGTKMNARLNNCVFANNIAGVYLGGSEKIKLAATMTNCTFYRNGPEPFGKRWYPSFNQQGAEYYIKMRFLNCAFWETVGNATKIFQNQTVDGSVSGAWFYVDYCSFQPLDPIYLLNELGDSVYFGVYPNFVDTAGLDFRLKKCSPVMNRGSLDTVLAAGIDYDLLGLPRVRFGRPDLGAYEQQDSCFVSSSQNPIIVKQLVISPNPIVSDYFELHFDAGLVPQSGRLRILKSDGSLLSDKVIELNESVPVKCREWGPGAYFILLETKEGVYSGKLIRE